ncbi:hypothetical protein CBR_g44334 [Chara braunii]|uniref:Uncharacterized protein n=1 Tax=Chara braunii TaxID=69332 RepID=A0A388K327_CHABU|nr:hypothetical protein CBR_g44334 [Chara braunii]|eukprot:GBG64448.1 hypothetical protein CBR_g44334 [Chara braunii]
MAASGLKGAPKTDINDREEFYLGEEGRSGQSSDPRGGAISQSIRRQEFNLETREHNLATIQGSGLGSGSNPSLDSKTQ